MSKTNWKFKQILLSKLMVFGLGILCSHGQTVKVSSYDIVDATEAISKAMNSNADTIIIDKRPELWQVSPMKFRNIKEKVIIFETGTELIAKPGHFTKTNDALLEFTDCMGITIIGNNAKLCMNKEEYLKGEWRHGISLRGSENIKITNLKIKDTGGDGIYIAGSKKNLFSQKIWISEISSLNNRRQGISIISAKNVEIKNCNFEDTAGTLPSAGLDIEPNRSQDIISEISIVNCIFKNNFGTGILLALGKLNSSSKPISVNFKNCTIKNNHPKENSRFGAEIVIKANKDNPVKGAVLFENCLISDSNSGFLYSRKRADAYSVSFVDCMIANISENEISPVIYLEVPDYKKTTGPLGGFIFDKLHIKNKKNVVFMKIRGSRMGTLTELKNLNGQIITQGNVQKTIEYIHYKSQNNINVNFEFIEN